MKNLFLLLALLLPVAAPAAEHLLRQQTFNAIAQQYSGEAAQENDRQIIEYHRIQGSPMMAAVAQQVVLEKLKAAGIEARIEQFPSDGKTRYQTHISPMGWDMRGGELWVESAAGQSSFTPVRICRYSDLPMCVATYSKGGEWTGELIDVGPGTRDADYKDRVVRGKVVLASGYAENVVRQSVVERGAVGAVIYPSATDRPEHPHMVRYNGIWPRAEELNRTSGAFQISASQYAYIHDLMQRGAVRVRGNIDATLGPGNLTLVHAYIRGRGEPAREVMVTGHLDHPKWSANDNASGSAAMIEMAATIHSLVAAGKIPPPKQTIHFMWVPEYFGTIAYLTKHPEARACGPWDDPRPAGTAAPCIVASLNLDMVGEDTVKTNGLFYITRTPDSVPSFLDALMSDVLEQTREAALYAPSGTRNYWPAEMAPFAQGSDHEPLLGIGVPATMLGHDPDWTHHTSEDTPDKTDASEFRRVGVLATGAAVWLATAEPEDLRRLSHLGAADIIAGRAQRIARALGDPDSAATQRRIQENAKVMAVLQSGYLNGRTPPANPSALGPASATQTRGGGLRRQTLLPIAAPAYEPLTGDDRKWWDEQSRRFSGGSSGGSLPTGVTFGTLVFETINFMDATRTSVDIAGLLSAEFDWDIEAAWVERLVGILAGLGLVAKP